MKLASSNAPVEVVGGSKSKSFSIAMNGKAFKLLSDTLYQNKIGSIVREISCNAYDAHVMAGKSELPFVIHLPDAFEPWFSVQDFGVGLSPSDIESVFTVYFESTKDNTNDAVGAFGLGAKTPFSYTDQFTVTSIKDGVCYMYSAFITKSGVPDIAEMGRSQTNEPNGVEIRMSVKREDYRRFAEETATQLRFFKIKPVIKNSNNFTFKSVSSNLALQSANVAISNDSAGYGQSWAYIVQGNVGYPLDVGQLKITPDNRRMLDALSGSQVQLFFDIGEIGVTASREGVEYNAYTNANIDAKLTAVRAEVTAYISNQISTIPRDWDKALFLNCSNALSKLARAADIAIPNVKRNSSGLYYFDFGSVLVDDKKKTPSGHPVVLGNVKCWTHNSSVRQPIITSITPSSRETIVLFLRDTGNRPNIRAKHFLSTQTQITKLIEIESSTIDNLFTPEFIKNLTETLGGYDTIVRASSIEPPAKVTLNSQGKQVKVNYTRPTCYVKGQEGGTNIRNWTKSYDELVDNEEEVLYTTIQDMAVTASDEEEAIKTYDKLCCIFTDMPIIYGIREGDMKKIKDMPNYVNVKTYVDGRMQQLRDDRSMYFKWRRMARGAKIFDAFDRYLIEDYVLNTLIKNAPKSPAVKYLKAKKKYSKFSSETVLLNVASLMEWQIGGNEDNKLRKISDSMYDTLAKRYPFMAVYADWQVRQKVTPEHLAKYLSSM